LKPIIKGAFDSIGLTRCDILLRPSIGSLIYLAHTADSSPPLGKLFSNLLETILTSIQTNIVIDESLSILLGSLGDAQNKLPKQELTTEVVIPLLTILTPLASTHPDPNVRQQGFRIISLVLSLTPSSLRLQTLVDLTSDTDLPQMCVAAVGLVKEAVLEALSQDVRNIFASHLFFQAFGPVLFRSRPPDLFSSPSSMKNMQELQELPRLVECLSLYYVLLLRDKDNRVRQHIYPTDNNLD
jgi:hypothetical protein